MRMSPLFVVLIATAPLAAGQPQQTPEALAGALQARYAGIRDFRADFVQTYRGGVLRTQTREQGTVAVKKPGRMRWMYNSPERKEFVSDGVKMYSYLPADRQVLVSTLPAGEDAPTGILFLAGRGNVATDFTPNLVDSPIAGSVALRLVPRRRELDYEYLVVAFDPSTLQIRGLVTRDRQGGESTLRFDNLKENVGISDKEFAFRIPRGVDVVADGLRN
jgi:outer membrane lipoprotein carrier protein